MATASPLPPTVDLWVVLTESKRIINAHSRHFLALSVLFLLPLSFSVTVYPSVSRLIIDQSSSSHNSVSLLRTTLHHHHHDASDTKTPLLLLIAYISVVAVFNLLAIGSISFSVHQGFYGRPVKLISAVRSSFSSFLPLLATLITSNLIVSSIFSILGFAAFLLTRLTDKISVDQTSTVVIFIALAFVVKLYANWILSWSIVVAESSWGLTPLKRSKALIKGMESVSLSMILVFAAAQACFVWVSAAASAQMEDDGEMWTKAFFVLQIVATSAVLTVLMLYYVAGSTVMYVHCKAVRGELAWEIAEEFGREYVSLPFDDGKVPRLVSVAYNNNV